MSVLRARLRPVPWAWLVPATAALAALAATPRSPAALDALAVAAVAVGAFAAPLAAPETDPPAPLLLSVPRPVWRTHALRLAAWLALATATVGAAAALIAARTSWDLSGVLWAVLPNLLLAGALAFGLAAVSSTLTGAGTTLALLLLVMAAGPSHSRFPLRLLEHPGDPLWATSRRWLLGGAALAVAAALPGWWRGGWWRHPGWRAAARRGRRGWHERAGRWSSR
jgi:hypothetical protein